ncbi:MAG: glycosyltransferase family 4 protein [Planctomycetota bacterium]
MVHSDAKIIYLTAGAGGMFCGSCMHDNALSKALSNHGWNIQLVPTYTPIRTDEDNVSVDQVLFGGINVYLQQKIPLFRYLPGFLDRFLDSPWLIRKVTSKAVDADATLLGQMALSMLKGSGGRQAKEVAKLCKWIQLNQADLVIFSNVLIGGCIADLKKALDIPVLVTLQGDDVFLDSLKKPFRQKCIDQIKKIVPHVDGFIVQSQFFRAYMGEYFGIPEEKFFVTPLGIELDDFSTFRESASKTKIDSQIFNIGYMARLAPEKGLHHLVDAFLELKQRPQTDDFRLTIAGWLSSDNQEYAQAQWKKLSDAGLDDQFDYLGSIDRTEKLELFRSLDLLTVPTEFLEPKGIYVLESFAAGVPVIQPAHGAFPELVEASQGGWLVPPKNPVELANHWQSASADREELAKRGRSGQEYVFANRDSQSMAESTSEVIARFV